MAGLTVPVVSIVIGEGGSGGALALGVANEIYMLEHATYSVISPEGAASILWKDANYSEEAAEALKMTAQHLEKFGLIHGIVPEVLGGAHQDVHEQASYLKETIQQSLTRLTKLSEEELIEHRYNHFRQIGVFSE